MTKIRQFDVRYTMAKDTKTMQYNDQQWIDLRRFGKASNFLA